MDEPNRPITPAEVKHANGNLAHACIISAFNRLIAANWSGCYATFSINDVIVDVERQIPWFTKGPLRLRDENFGHLAKMYEVYGWTVHFRDGKLTFETDDCYD